MMYITIDTCILERLINEAADDWSLDPIHQFVTSNQLRFLAPPTLKGEWQDHKKRKTEGIQKKERTHRKEREKSENLNIFDAEGELSTDEKRVRRQVEKLDAIIDSSPEIEKYSEIILMIDDLKEQKAPPFFHTTEKQNEKDAKIIFLCLEYAKRNAIKEFVFVSDNSTEFESKDKKGELHLNIQQRYPDIKVHYFKSPLKAVEFLKQTGLTVKQPSSAKEKLVNPTISVDHKLHILDQLFNYFSIRLKNWTFLPKNFIVNQHPFVVGKYALESPIAYAFVTDNLELFNFLKSLSVSDGHYVTTYDLGKVENSSQKIIDILGWFRTNSIFNVIHKGHEGVELPFVPPDPTCTCYACKWSHQEYNSIRKDLATRHHDLKEKIDQAYAAYELSEYRSAIDILLEALEQAKAESNHVQAFICQYNIRLLKQQHNHTKYGDEFPDPLTKVDEFDIEDTIHLMPKADQEIAYWLYNGSTYDDYLLTILQNSQKLRKALRGKRPLQTHHYNDFFEKFNDVWRFLSVNRIVGDQLVEFTDIYKAFQEGLLQILALDKANGGGKIALSLQHLLLLVRYGSYKEIQELIIEYKLFEIPHTDIDGKELISCYLRLIDELATYPNNEVFNQGPQYFHENMNRMLEVYNTIFQYIGLPVNQINIVAEKLLQYSRIPHLLKNSRYFTSITNFLISQGAIIDKRILGDFVIQYIQKNRILDFQSTAILLTHLNKRSTRFTYTPESSKVIQALALRALVNDDADRLSHLLELSLMSSDENDRIEANRILGEFLSAKFLPHCYAVARVMGYLMEEPCLFSTYLEYMENYIKTLAPYNPENPFDFYGNDITVDQFLNLHFKEYFPLSESTVCLLRDRCLYYRWLLDPEGYDYSKFNLEWMWHASTFYYRRYLKKSEALRLKLLEIYRKSKRQDIGNLLIKLYVGREL